jgi:hypothetical protein
MDSMLAYKSRNWDSNLCSDNIVYIKIIVIDVSDKVLYLNEDDRICR